MLDFFRLVVSFLSDFLSIICDITIVGELTVGSCVFLILVIGVVLSIMWGKKGE